MRRVKLPDWVVQAFIIGACSISTGYVISMRSDITTLMIRTEGVDKMVMQHTKDIDRHEGDLKLHSQQIYEIKMCCE